MEHGANPGPANEASGLQEGDDSDALLVAFSGVLLDVSCAGEEREGSVRMSSSIGRERSRSPVKGIPLALKWSSQLNIQHSAEPGGHAAQGNMTQKRKRLFDDKNCDKGKTKRFCLASMARECLERENGPKRSASFDDEDGHEHKPKRYPSSLCVRHRAPRWLRGQVTLPPCTNLQKRPTNTTLHPRRWDNRSPHVAGEVASPHQ